MACDPRLACRMLSVAPSELVRTYGRRWGMTPGSMRILCFHFQQLQQYHLSLLQKGSVVLRSQQNMRLLLLWGQSLAKLGEKKTCLGTRASRRWFLVLFYHLSLWPLATYLKIYFLLEFSTFPKWRDHRNMIRTNVLFQQLNVKASAFCLGKMGWRLGRL